jgi:hypothetical protein
MFQSRPFKTNADFRRKVSELFNHLHRCERDQLIYLKNWLYRFASVGICMAGVGCAIRQKQDFKTSSRKFRSLVCQSGLVDLRVI